MFLRQKLLAHLETWRPYTSFYVGLLALGAATVWHGGLLPLDRALATFAAPTLGWLAGLYGCDYFDRELDKIQKAHRPIPSGRISEREAVIAMLVCMYLGFVGSAWLGFSSLLLAGGAMAASIAYTITKSHAILGNLSRGLPGALTVVFGAVVGGPALTGGWIVPVLFFLHDATTNLVGAIRDVEGDRAGQCVTVPVRYGVRAAMRICVGMAAIWELFALLLPWLLPLDRGPYYLFALPALGLALAGLGLLSRRPGHRPTALLAHKCFVVERMLLSGALIAGAGGLVAALAITLPLIAVAQWSQVRLRDRHEFGRPPAHTVTVRRHAPGLE
jgi:4-hydroxybenzoate polyprenyltransferase/geranylgeranylglycerol-phosphate geranylgeranyltransferase